MYENFYKNLNSSNEDLFPKINDDRVITITCSNTTVSDRDWRHSLSRLISNQEGRKTSEISVMFDATDNIWNVDDRIKLLMTDNKAIKIQNTADTPLSALGSGNTKSNSVISKIGKAFMGIAEGISALSSDDETTSGSFNPWIANVKAWGGGSKMNLQCSFDFTMGQYGLWSAKEEVVKPILNLMAPILPQYMNSFMQYGAFPNTLQLLTSLIKDALSAWRNSKVTKNGNPNNNSGTGSSTNTNSTEETPIDSEPVQVSTNDIQNLAQTLENFLLDEYKKYTYDIKFGNTFTFYKMLPISASPKFSNEVDDEGYPISGSIEISYEGLMPVTLASATEEERAARFGKYEGSLH